MGLLRRNTNYEKRGFEGCVSLDTVTGFAQFGAGALGAAPLE